MRLTLVLEKGDQIVTRHIAIREDYDFSCIGDIVLAMKDSLELVETNTCKTTQDK